MEIEQFVKETGLSTEVCHFVLQEIGQNKKNLNLVVKKIGGKGSGYAVLNDDFPILLESSKLFATLLAGLEFKEWIPLALAGAIHQLFLFRKKRIPISATQALILKELKDTSGLSTEDLESGHLHDILGGDIIRTELSNLEHMKKEDGSAVSLVGLDDNGVWKLIDV